MTAVRAALRRAIPGDLVVCCVDDAIAVYREAMAAAGTSRGGTAFADPGEWTPRRADERVASILPARRRMKDVGWRDRLRYRFDEFMGRGTIALILGLFVISIVLIVAVALVVSILRLASDPSQGQDLDFLTLLRYGLLRTLDPGTMGGDQGTAGFLLAMFVDHPRRHLRHQHAHRHPQQRPAGQARRTCARAARGSSSATTR